MAGMGILARRMAALFLGMALLFSGAAGSAASPTVIRIGILANERVETTRQQWNATAAYLAQAQPDLRFEIVPLSFSRVEGALRERRIDFLLTNPASYIELRERFGLNALLTVQRQLAGGAAASVFSGAIVTRAERSDIQRLADLRGKHLAAVDKDSFGGWAMAWRQMQRAGLDPYEELASIDFAGSHENVVRAVMSGAADAGSVRSGVLERMAARGELRLQDIRVLPEESLGIHQDYELPELHSTPYYPEWPLARLPHVEDGVARQVTQALLAMPATAPAAVDAAIAGWVPALNYAPVEELMKELRLAQFRQYGENALMVALQSYWYWLVAVAMVMAALALLILHVVRLNRRNLQINRELQQELAEKRGVQQQVLAQKERLAHILETITEAYFAVDSDWRITAINGQAQEMLDNGRHSLTGNDLWAALPELALIAYSSFSRSLEMGEPLEFTAYYSGSDQWLEFHTYPLGGEMEVYFRDVTARIRATEQLEESEQRLSAILENMLEGVITIDARGLIQSFNRAAQAIFGYREDEVVGKSLDMLMPHDQHGTHGQFIGGYLGGGVARVIGIGREINGQRKNGEVFPMDISVSEILINGQRVFVGIFRDISARREVEARALQLAAAIDHAAEGVFITDVRGQIGYANPAYARMRGVAAQLLPGTSLPLFDQASQQQEQYSEPCRILREEGLPWSGHYPVTRGGLRYIEEATITPVRDQRGAISGYVGVCRDITGNQHHREQQLHAGRIEATAAMAVSIVQECQTLLGTVIDRSSLAMAELDPHDVAAIQITQMVGAASRARVLMQQLLNFGEQEYVVPRLLKPYPMVKGAVALLQSVLPATVSVKQHLTAEAAELWIAPGQFQQVITSLVLDTIKTVDDQPGSVEVTLGRHHLSRGGEEEGTALAAGDYLLLQISENISSPSVQRTGLEWVEEIVASNGGALLVDLSAGRGITLRIFLPLVTTGG